MTRYTYNEGAEQAERDIATLRGQAERYTDPTLTEMVLLECLAAQCGDRMWSAPLEHQGYYRGYMDTLWPARRQAQERHKEQVQ